MTNPRVGFRSAEVHSQSDAVGHTDQREQDSQRGHLLSFNIERETRTHPYRVVSVRRSLTYTCTHTHTTQELGMLEEGAVVYKLVGPALVKQELSEAKLTVDKRLEYITKEA